MCDYEIDYEVSCPECGHSPLHSRDCTNFCDDGYFDEADDDPINFVPGESERECPECKGTGIEWWCPNCGANLSGRMEECIHEDELIELSTPLEQTVRKCRVCGCTDDDCRQCIKKTGQPCSWVEKDLCSACKNEK